jgi:demethylmenaquinone methyltransferase/2-methoxy-6-polyprenyl-1,4-benzoquinol methylase
VEGSLRRGRSRASEQILDMAGTEHRVSAWRARCLDHRFDINQDMLDVGIERAMNAASTASSGRARTPRKRAFGNRFFDAYTIAFGIRNVTHIDKALAEAHRVLKFGGRFFASNSRRRNGPVLPRSMTSIRTLVPKIGQAIAGDADLSLPDRSIRRFPKMGEFER